MNPTATADVPLTRAEFRQLPREEQERILAEAAELLREDYAPGGDLTGFEAFGPRDLYGESSDSRPG